MERLRQLLGRMSRQRSGAPRPDPSTPLASYFEGGPDLGATGQARGQRRADQPAPLPSATPRVRRLPRFEEFAHDFRIAVRFLRKNPVFTVVAVLTLALGIGGNTAIFSATYGIVLKALPYPAAERLIEIRASRLKPTPAQTKYISIPAMDDVSTQSHTLEQIACYVPAYVTLNGRQQPQALTGTRVSGSFFSVYGVAALYGRFLLPSDTEVDRDRVAVLSYGVWQRVFGGDPSVIGTDVPLAIQPVGVIAPQAPPSKLYTIVGVMPPRERFPLDGDIWVPLRTVALTPRMGVSPRLVRNVATIARIKPEATVSQVSDELHLIATRLASQYPDTDQNWDMRALTMRDAVAENYSTALLLLLGAVNFVLLLACVSVSSLLVARNRARRRDVAIYETLGATRARLIRQFLSESVLLAVVGGAFGLLLAYWGVKLLRIAAPASTPRLDEIALDWRVLAYTVVVSCASGILLGLAPAIQLTTPELSTAMRETAHASRVRAFPIPFRVRGLIIGCQIALAFPLVVGSMLALRSLDRLLQVDLGYQRDHVLTMYVKLSASRCPKFEACLAAIDEIVQRGRTLPGIDSFAVAGSRPLSQPLGMAITVEGETDSTQGNTAPTEYQIVTPEYFRTLSLPLRAGRLLNDHDIDDDAPVAVVNETLARRRFGGDPVGKRLKIAAMGADWITVVGEVADARNFSPARDPMPALYVPLRQARLLPRVTILARTSVNPMAVATAVQQQVWAVDKDAPITEVKTLDQVMTETVAEPRFQTWLLSVFAALGLTLALVGIYGLISYAVSGRFREFGVRLAIGAQPRDILWLVLSESLSAVGFGLVAGIAIALGLTQFLKSLLFAIAPTDAATFAGVAVLIAAVAALAYYIPARRAARVDPVRVLRED